MNRVLNKVKVGVIVGAALTILKHVVPQTEEILSPELTDAIIVVTTAVSQFFTKESIDTVQHLELKEFDPSDL